MLKISLQDEALHLLPSRALHWPRAATVMVADVHIGKCAAFRQAGIPISIATTAHDLLTLTQVLTTTQAERLVILGDFLHAGAAQHAAITELLMQWRARHKTVEMILIRGNHDQHAGDPHTDLSISCVDDCYLMAPFLLTHDIMLRASYYTLAGHVHPVINLYGTGRDKLRLPCFYFAEHYGLLPAFGNFTGGYAMNSQAKAATIYTIADNCVIKV